MALTPTSNALALACPLSPKLQRKSLDIVKAYSPVHSTISDLEAVCHDEEAMDEWFRFQQASTLAETAHVEPCVP